MADEAELERLGVLLLTAAADSPALLQQSVESLTREELQTAAGLLATSMVYAMRFAGTDVSKALRELGLSIG